MVTVHHKEHGCPICGSRQRHEHTQEEWERLYQERKK